MNKVSCRVRSKVQRRVQVCTEWKLVSQWQDRVSCLPTNQSPDVDAGKRMEDVYMFPVHSLSSSVVMDTLQQSLVFISESRREIAVDGVIVSSYLILLLVMWSLSNVKGQGSCLEMNTCWVVLLVCTYVPKVQQLKSIAGYIGSRGQLLRVSGLESSDCE